MKNQSTDIFKNDEARKRLDEWYQTFLNRAAIETTSHEVPTSYGNNHVLMAGDSEKPPIVCLHSMLTSSAHLVSELTALASHFQIIAPDLPGQSVKGLPVRLSYSDYSHSDWLHEILDGLNLKTAHLLGVSLGGFVARQYATAHPYNVSSLTLIVPAGIASGSLSRGLTKMALPIILYKFRPTEKNLQRLVDPLITTWDDDWAAYLGDSFNDFIPNFKIPPLASDEELNQLTMPCLVVGAEKDISFPGQKVIDRVNSQIPSVETELISDSKHSPPTTPEFRAWLGNRILEFTGAIHPAS